MIDLEKGNVSKDRSTGSIIQAVDAKKPKLADGKYIQDISKINQDIASIKSKAKNFGQIKGLDANKQTYAKLVDTEKDHEFELDDPARNKLKTTSREQYLHMLQQEQDRQRQMSIISFQPQTLFEKPQNRESSHEREAYKKDSTHEPSASNEVGFNESDD